jgi:hypothetical protein
MLLQSLLRPVLTPLMRGMFDAPIASSAAWSPLALWPDGIDSPGMWISPRDLTSQWADYTGTTPVATPGTVADSSNPVGLAYDLRAGATVLTDPGIHMLQSTSAARPLLSARVNLLTKTEDFADAAWTKTNLTIVQNAGLAPDGTNTLIKLNETAVNSDHFVAHGYVSSVTKSKWQITAKQGERSQIYIASNGGGYVLFLVIDLTNGTVVSNSGSHLATDIVITSVANGAYSIVFSYDPLPGSQQFTVGPAISGSNSYQGVTGSGIYIWHPQLELGSTATAYQRVGAASDYDATDFPIFQKYDGVDDGMATAAFAAGTLIDGMDCLIAVRRDSAAACVAGLYNGIADATKFFGMAESASGSGCVGSGAGTPTVWVDNAQLTGGTAVTRGTLHTALTVGDYHILEFRGLDLSTWTAAGFGLYTSYVFPGARGDIMLFPSTASTEDKDAARQYLADYYGVTLP